MPISTFVRCLSTKFEKVLFEFLDSSAKLDELKATGCMIRESRNGFDEQRTVFSAKISSDEVCVSHNLVKKSDLEIGAKYRIIFAPYSWSIGGKSGTALRGYVLEKTTDASEPVPADVKTMLDAR